MMRTYTGTWMRPNLKDAAVELHIFDGCKYTAECKEDIGEETELVYKGITSYDIIEGGDEAKEIEKTFNDVDEFHEYLVLHFENGEIATFKNSHVSMFIW